MAFMDIPSRHRSHSPFVQSSNNTIGLNFKLLVLFSMCSSKLGKFVCNACLPSQFLLFFLPSLVVVLVNLRQYLNKNFSILFFLFLLRYWGKTTRVICDANLITFSFGLPKVVLQFLWRIKLQVIQFA